MAWRFRRKGWQHDVRSAEALLTLASSPSIDAKSTRETRSTMGFLKNAMISVGLAQPGPKITAHDRAILEWVTYMMRLGCRWAAAAKGTS